MLLLLTLSVSVCALAEAEDLNRTKYVCAYSGLNLRSAPDLKDSEIVIAMLFNGRMTVHKLDETGLFAFVTYENLGKTYEGWCWNGYLSNKITKRAHKSSKKKPGGTDPEYIMCLNCKEMQFDKEKNECMYCSWFPDPDPDMPCPNCGTYSFDMGAQICINCKWEPGNE